MFFLYAVAEAIGVFAEPEVTEMTLTPAHPFLILASDGVFEFISSEKAVEIVSRCKDPREAVKALVSTAYKAWLQRETRTDDISVVVLFFEYGDAGVAADTNTTQDTGTRVAMSK